MKIFLFFISSLFLTNFSQAQFKAQYFLEHSVKRIQSTKNYKELIQLVSQDLKAEEIKEVKALFAKYESNTLSPLPKTKVVKDTLHWGKHKIKVLKPGTVAVNGYVLNYNKNKSFDHNLRSLLKDFKVTLTPSKKLFSYLINEAQAEAQYKVVPEKHDQFLLAFSANIQAFWSTSRAASAYLGEEAESIIEEYITGGHVTCSSDKKFLVSVKRKFKLAKKIPLDTSLIHIFFAEPENTPCTQDKAKALTGRIRAINKELRDGESKHPGIHHPPKNSKGFE